MNTVKIKETAQDIRGNTLNVSMAEESTDISALKTIENSHPDFIVPFTHKITDGEMEFTYNLQGLVKFMVLSGTKTKADYLLMWNNIINPLMEFDDWFMKSSSFVFDINHVYVDMRTNKVKYVYIPTVENYSESEDLRNMFVDIEGQNQTQSHEIAHPILRALNGRNFNIIEFKKIIDKLKYNETQEPEISQDIPKAEYEKKPDIPVKQEDELIISVPQKIKKEKREKEKKEKKPIFNFNKKEKAKEENEFIDGAAAALLNDAYKSNSGDNNTEIAGIGFDDKTEILSEKENKSAGIFLKLTGNADFPDVINIIFTDKNVFSIGRVDNKAGIAQNDYEFPREMTGVSRRQAVIQKNADNYSIIHIGNANTFVNGAKMSAGETMNIKSGDKITFGSRGADYIFNA